MQLDNIQHSCKTVFLGSDVTIVTDTLSLFDAFLTVTLSTHASHDTHHHHCHHHHQLHHQNPHCHVSHDSHDNQDGDVSVSYQFSAGEGIKIQFSDQEWFSCLAFSAENGSQRKYNGYKRPKRDSESLFKLAT